jgi:hypothetical protein
MLPILASLTYLADAFLLLIRDISVIRGFDYYGTATASIWTGDSP